MPKEPEVAMHSWKRERPIHLLVPADSLRVLLGSLQLQVPWRDVVEVLQAPILEHYPRSWAGVEVQLLPLPDGGYLGVVDPGEAGVFPAAGAARSEGVHVDPQRVLLHAFHPLHPLELEWTRTVHRCFIGGLGLSCKLTASVQRISLISFAYLLKN